MTRLLQSCCLFVAISCNTSATKNKPTMTPILKCELDGAPMMAVNGGVRFTPDGDHLLVGTIDGFHVVDRERGSKQSTPTAKGYISNLAVMQDRNTAVYTSGNEAFLWDLTIGKVKSSHTLKENFSFSGVHVSNASNPITLLVHQGGELIQWDRKSGEKTNLYELSESALVPQSRISHDARSLAVHGTLAVIAVRPGLLLYDLNSRSEKQFVSVGDGAAVTDISFSPNGKILAASQGRRVWLFDTETWDRPIKATINRSGEGAKGLAFSPDGKTLYVATLSGNVRPSGVTLFDSKSGRNLGYFQTHPEWAPSLDVSPDGKYLATASKDGLKIWELEKVREFLKLPQE